MPERLGEEDEEPRRRQSTLFLPKWSRKFAAVPADTLQSISPTTVTRALQGGSGPSGRQQRHANFRSNKRIARSGGDEQEDDDDGEGRGEEGGGFDTPPGPMRGPTATTGPNLPRVVQCQRFNSCSASCTLGTACNTVRRTLHAPRAVWRLAREAPPIRWEVYERGTLGVI